MKRLTLVRHAKAEPKHPQHGDYDRALTPHGRAQAENLGRVLVREELIPHLLMASPAERTRQTAQILAHELAIAMNLVRYEQRLYLAAPKGLLDVIHSTSPEVAHLMLVGHNPGLSELVRLLVPKGNFSELATADAYTMTFEADRWSQVGTSHPPLMAPGRFFGPFQEN